MTAVTNNRVASLTTYKLKQKGVLLISPTLAAQITALHKAWAKEWSGMLLFRPVNEDLSNPENFRAVAEAVYPMDFGSETYTEYDFSAEEVLEMYERYPKAAPEKGLWKLGHIHTHHTMQTFFSGTDEKELRDNVEKYAYYLSLIVNFSGHYSAKIAFIAETGRKTVYKTKSGKKIFSKEPEEVLCVFELDVKIMLDEWYTQRINEVDKISRERRPTKTTNYYAGNNYTPGTVHRGTYGDRFQTNVGQQATIPVNSTSIVSSKRDRPKLEGHGSYLVKEKIKAQIPYLLFKSPETAAKVKLYSAFEELHNIYKTEDQQQGYVGWVLGKFYTWFRETFKEDIEAGHDEEAIAWEFLRALTIYDPMKPLVVKLDRAFTIKFEKEFKPTVRLASDIDPAGPSEDKSFESITNRIGFGQGYEGSD